MNILYIDVKQVIWKFRICNYFREMFKFRDFMNTLRNFEKSVFARIFAKFKYLAKQFICNSKMINLFNSVNFSKQLSLLPCHLFFCINQAHKKRCLPDLCRR